MGGTGQRRDRDWRWVAVDRGEPYPPISIEAGRTGRTARRSSLPARFSSNTNSCEPVCPVEAIFYEDDVPAQWKDFTATNAAFFTEGDEPLGSPGGFSKIGPLVHDTAFVANYQLPRQLTAQPTSRRGRDRSTARP